MSSACLVTGGAGFIGSHLVERLLRQGRRVTVLDDLSTGRSANLRDVEEHDRLTVVEGDVRSPETVDPLVEDADIVFHLAAHVGVERVIGRGVQTIEANTAGTRSVLAAADRHSSAVFLASSSEVYGSSDRLPFSESDPTVIGPPTRPRWTYAAAKLVDEFLALSYQRERGVPVVIARFFNVIGPRQSGRHGMVLPRFIDQARRGDDLTVFGDGLQTRTFCDVGDAVDAIASLVETPESFGNVVNIGGDRELSILELAHTVITELESPSEVRHVPYEDAGVRDFDEPRRRVPDLSRVRDLIAWEPTTPLSHTIAAMLASRDGAGPARP